jgi:hypothetical protein
VFSELDFALRSQPHNTLIAFTLGALAEGANIVRGALAGAGR